MWHKAIGATLLVGGFVLAFVCTVNVWNIHHFGGHVWYLVAFGIIISSTWWFGLFDPA